MTGLGTIFMAGMCHFKLSMCLTITNNQSDCELMIFSYTIDFSTLEHTIIYGSAVVKHPCFFKELTLYLF